MQPLPEPQRFEPIALEAGLVSVIIPSYNHAGYLPDAVQSVLRQSYRQWEIIVVDDGSTDNTREVVRPFGDQVRYIYQENQGLSAARNTGICAAVGEFIAVLDADDTYEPEFLTAMVAALRHDPEAGAVYCGFQFVDESNQSLPQVGNRAVRPEEFHQTLLDGNFLVPECMLARRKCYQDAGWFDVRLRACEDWDMWLRLALRFKVIALGRLLTRHRVLPGSMSSDPTRMQVNRFAVLEKVFGPEDSSGGAEHPGQKRSYGRAYFATALELLQYGDRMKSQETLRKAFEISPELLLDPDVFYELGCGDQPKGTRGDFASIRLAENARFVVTFLDRWFDDQREKPAFQKYRRSAYANAYAALGSLAYGAGHFGWCRVYLLRAAGFQPSCLLKGQTLPTLAKACLGKRTVSLLKRQPIFYHL